MYSINSVQFKLQKHKLSFNLHYNDNNSQKNQQSKLEYKQTFYIFKNITAYIKGSQNLVLAFSKLKLHIYHVDQELDGPLRDFSES